MEIIDKELLKKYINGEEFEENLLDSLENNIEFMKAVVEATNDSNIYNVCSNNVRNDANFLVYMINKFDYDTDFVTKILIDFLNSNELRYTKEQLEVMISVVEKFENQKFVDNLGNNKKEKVILYNMITKMLKDAMYPYVMEEFDGILSEFKDSKIICDYFAKQMFNVYIKHILACNNCNFETLIHNKFKTKEEAMEYGIERYLIEEISMEDEKLANYLKKSLNDSSIISNNIAKVLNNWHQFEKNKEVDLFEKIIDDVTNYCRYYSVSPLNVDVVLFMVSQRLGIIDEISKIYPFNEDEFESNLGFYEGVDYENVKKIVENDLNGLDNDLIIQELGNRKREYNRNLKRKKNS